MSHLEPKKTCMRNSVKISQPLWRMHTLFGVDVCRIEHTDRQTNETHTDGHFFADSYS